MSLGDSAEPGPLRVHYTAELNELKLQTEMMGVLVDQNLERMREVLITGDRGIAARAIAADDEIDAMNVSLTEHCYRVLARENPMAHDLRLVVSVIRVTGTYERIGDLSLRVAKVVDDQPLVAAHPEIFRILETMAGGAVGRFREALRAWASDDVELAGEVAAGSGPIDAAADRLTEAMLSLTGPDAVKVALRANTIGHSLQRISDHASILGRRIQYLVTGDEAYLAAEVR